MIIQSQVDSSTNFFEKSISGCATSTSGCAAGLGDGKVQPAMHLEMKTDRRDSSELFQTSSSVLSSLSDFLGIYLQ